MSGLFESHTPHLRPVDAAIPPSLVLCVMNFRVLTYIDQLEGSLMNFGRIFATLSAVGLALVWTSGSAVATTTPQTKPPVVSAPCVVGPGVAQTATTVTGSAGDDTIDCTNASPGKTIYGLAGNDTVTGTAYADKIYGGTGNDTMTGGPGNDTLKGDAGNDTVTGSAGNDSLVGGTGADTLSGGTGSDTISAVPADASADILNGGTETDTCSAVTAEGDTITACEK